MSHFSHRKHACMHLRRFCPLHCKRKRGEAATERDSKTLSYCLCNKMIKTSRKCWFFSKHMAMLKTVQIVPFSSEFFRFSRKFLLDFPCELEAIKRLRHDWVERSDWWGCTRLIIHKHRRGKWRTRREGARLLKSHMSPKHDLTSWRIFGVSTKGPPMLVNISSCVTWRWAYEKTSHQQASRWEFSFRLE